MVKTAFPQLRMYWYDWGA